MLKQALGLSNSENGYVLKLIFTLLQYLTWGDLAIFINPMIKSKRT